MAKIVIGIGTSHGPMLVTETETWGARLPADYAAQHPYKGSLWSYEDLVEARKDEGLAAQITRTEWDTRQLRCQKAIEQLADVYEAAKPDICVIIGNDQMEIFGPDMIPAFAVYCGAKIPNHELPEDVMKRLPVGIDISIPGYIPSGGADYLGVPELGEAIVRQAIADEFDVTILRNMPKPQTPHAYGFIYRRIMRDAPIPSVPVMINTFFPPNQPTVARCYDFGKSILRAIQNWDSNLRVAVMASGGLTHFVIDEEVDQVFIQAIRDRDMARISALGEAVFQDGTSEIKNWVPLAGMMADIGFTPELVDYVPCYRSEAGTGNAMAFMQWLPRGE
jgi:3-O-methylgallate 3,4-dioxygenase